jgi:hypothetical protein
MRARGVLLGIADKLAITRGQTPARTQRGLTPTTATSTRRVS